MRPHLFTWIVTAGVALVVGGAIAATQCSEARREARRQTQPKRRYRPIPVAQALGDLGGLPAERQRAFRHARHFAPLPEPGPGDWLDSHPENGQTWEQFLRGGSPRPTAERRIFALQPVGAFPPERSPRLEDLRDYASAFFQLPVEILPTLDASALRVETRINEHTRQLQLHVGQINERLKARLRPSVHAVIAVTMTDLWSGPGWNFVFGQATFRERVGAFSFARYDPAFFGKPRPPGWQRRLLWSAMKVLTHEAGHMFGLWHCVHYRCVMNGSNTLEEDQHVPVHLCPPCLRKLHHAIGFAPEAHYRAVAAFYRRVGLAEEAAFAELRLAWIEDR
jgi:archaemetzincin